MNIKEKFIRDLIDELNRVNERELNNENKISVCYLVSVVDQHIEECTDFMNAISKYNYHIDGYEEDHSSGYTNGKIRVLIEKPDEEKESDFMVDAFYNYYYCIEFLYDERMWGYCQCTLDDDGYDPEHDCCGCGCDWTAPAFRITKVYDLGYYKWDGYQRDYWEYERQFKIKESVNNEEVARLEKEKIKKRLEEEIAKLQQRIDSL